MLRRTLAHFLVLSAVCAPFALAEQAAPRGVMRCGPWWKGQTEMGRTYFVLGFVDAMAASSRLLTSARPQAAAVESTAAQKATAASLNYADIKIWQLTEGLTEFYKDSKNEGVSVEVAMSYVRDSIKGRPTPVQTPQITEYRPSSR